MGLIKDNQRKQDIHLQEIATRKNDEMLFCDFIALHPTLYEGVRLDQGTIDYINYHFYEYTVSPINFERRFITKLRRLVDIYNNLKAIELQDMVFDITTNKYIRELTADTISDIKRTGTTNGTNQRDSTSKSTGKDSGTNKETRETESEGNVANTGSSTTQENKSTTAATNSSTDSAARHAEKSLPMETTGTGFDGIVDWSSGGTGISENRNEGSGNTETRTTVTDTTTVSDNSEQDSTSSESVTVNGSHSNDTSGTTTYNETITDQDSRDLRDLANGNNKEYETLSVNEGQAVSLIQNIWNYLVSPKAIDYLVTNLEPCFYLVF